MSKYRCNFENSFCEWTNGEENSYNWRRTRGIDSKGSDILPQRDHTTNTEGGAYAYVETKSRDASSKSTLYGPIFETQGFSFCRFRFYYYMYGSSVGKLSVYYRTQDGGALVSVWSASGSFGQYWRRIDANAVQFYSTTPRQLVIVAEAANITRGDGVIAIDDFSFDSSCKASTQSLVVVRTTTKVIALH